MEKWREEGEAKEDTQGNGHRGRERQRVGDGGGEGAPGCKLHLEFWSKPLSFLKIAQPFSQQGWQRGLREARLPFYGKKIPNP